MPAHPLGSHSPGTTATEHMLMLTFFAVGLTAVATLFLGDFSAGISDLARDIVRLLALEDGRAGTNRSGQAVAGGGGAGGDDGTDTGSLPPFADPSNDPSGSGSSSSGGDGPWAGDPGTGTDGGPDEASDDDEEEQECPYVFDDASDRWRDPETGQYVPFDDAAAAGC